MSKIINNLNQSLEQQLNLNELQDSVDNNLQTEAKSIVGAINEIVGKQVISNAIGAPLIDSDTWSNMETKINGLLNSFKTNMMNNGVTVESGDKFKQLIDKIATMTEEGSGKGIQFASGEGNWACGAMPNVSSYTDFEYELIIPINIDFDPTYVFCLGDFSFFADFSSSNFSESAKNAALMNNQAMTSKYLTENNQTQYNVSIQSFTNSQIKIIGKCRSGQYMYSTCRMARPDNIYAWYAIGVGEEDTTLRDSLASILQDEGVEVSDEDDMASLINKVDEELDRINAETSIMKTGTATVSNLYSSTGTFTVNINPNFVPKEIICTITSFRFNYTSGSYTTITTPTVVYSKYNNTSSNYVTLSPRNGNYGADVYISSISQSNFVVTITRFTGSSIPSMSIEWIAIS